MSLPSIRLVRSFPTTIAPSDYDGPVHESCLRSFQVLRALVGLLRAGTPPDVALRVVELYDEEGATRYARAD